jgi:DUF971 family protein
MAAADHKRIPIEIRLRKRSRCLDVSFADGETFHLPAEYLRVHSPSAEVTGHQARVEPVGRYAVKLVFDDGHDTGLYTWDTLYELGAQFDAKWRRYLERLETAGERRSAAED